MSAFSVTPTRKREKDVDSCVFDALVCLYTAFTPSCGFRGVSECLCLRKSVCFEPCGCNNVQPRLLGVESGTDSDEICKVGLYCCDYALIQPRVCMALSTHTLCMKKGCSFPFHKDYVEEPMCAMYCISCLPDFGIAAPPTKPIMLERMSNPNYTGYNAEVQMEPMDRGLPLAKAVYEPVSVKDTEMI